LKFLSFSAVARITNFLFFTAMPLHRRSPFSEVATRKEKIFGPANGRIVRAAKKRRKDLDVLQKENPKEFEDLLKKHELNGLPPSQNKIDQEDGVGGVGDDDIGDTDDKKDDAEDSEGLFWNKPGSNVLADKETQKKYRMQRNPLPLETDKLLCQHVLSGDLRLALLCNSRPSLFGLPNSRERRKIDDRRRLLREMMTKRPQQFVEVCRAHSLEEDLVKANFVNADGSLTKEAAAAAGAAASEEKGKGPTSASDVAAAMAEGQEEDEDEEGAEKEDKSPTKQAAIQLQSLRRKASKKAAVTNV
jgi:hypothetical protein